MSTAGIIITLIFILGIALCWLFIYSASHQNKQWDKDYDNEEEHETTSFYKSFSIDDEKIICSFVRDTHNPKKVETSDRNYDDDKSKGLSLLKQRLRDK